MTLELANEDPDFDRGESQHKHHRRPVGRRSILITMRRVDADVAEALPGTPPIDVELDHQYFRRYGNAAGLPVREAPI